MPTAFEVLFSPAEFEALHQRDLRNTLCVVFDVLRATSSMITALSNGAATIIPVADIPEALKIRENQPDVLLAGERDGVRIRGDLTGSIEFDLGNSPREFTPEKVNGRTIVMTTTNGTRALRACAHAETVLVSSFLNLRATADFIAQRNPVGLLVICSGTYDQVAFEDVLGAGALCNLLWPKYGGGDVADSALIARRMFLSAEGDLLAGLSQARNGRRLLERPDLSGDVPFCARMDLFNLNAKLGKDGLVRRLA